MRRQIVTLLGITLLAAAPFAAQAEKKDFAISIGGPGYSFTYVDPGYSHYQPYGYSRPAPIYYAPRPVYVAPRPVYARPYWGYHYGYRNYPYGYRHDGRYRGY